MHLDQPIMQLRGVAKAFPNGTLALRGVDLDIRPGRVHGLLGANGAGKSTLIKILSGAYRATLGEIIWRGQPVSWDSPKAANDMGVATIHQHIPLVPTLSVLENVFLGSHGRWRRSSSSRLQFEELCKRIGYRLDPGELVGSLSIGARQMVSIFQALGTGADLIVMDEPTASLASEERELVYATVRLLSKGENKAILFVSHFLDEVMSLTDEVTVLRDGKAVLRAATADLDENQIAEAIVGKQIVALEHEAQQRHTLEPVSANQDPALRVRELASPGKLSATSFDVARGEVVGVAGLLGSGRSELLHAIYGSDKYATGSVVVDGKSLPRNTGAAVKAGIGLVPEDRMAQGLVPDFEIWRNVSLPALQGVSVFNSLPVAQRERERGWEAIRLLSIKADSPEILVKELSGGNAQKVTIAKWLFSDVKLFLLDEPTAGIDIGAKTEILRLVRQLAGEGKSVIIVSSEFEELLAVSDRILVMRDGRCIAERKIHETTETELLLLAGGQSANPEASNLPIDS
ncbi:MULTISPECIES: sugar ABC transporter ATP-binding protein [unclassified Mesorhizobium]|uniref:sugar ABC transporter ATP-binding protein n=1 Tax=unclassified Mesorhizobium TaxID=325217 RepID=UPI000FCC606C|nr:MULTISPECIES: sugar ABC transporter ATP-binding protein [unclassified Mesorhizobium]RUW78882.1 sugar ABC transporter ATP-binding protein [Mesorhizobium sp. M4B.F.Ca.ET.049.02.1.2]RVD30747.1 sugar ABC transporter ATP-binding protein [Mesorhizobium sp. M4B.F.Ca.ET.017.02.2.1]TGV28157.1 sugar ABC transporter ATP-binding protein [Mesorhizobium sp. M4B.F.Ca.ET.143.01.1.1]